VNSINIGLNVNVVNMARVTPAARRDSYHHGDLKRALTSAALSLVAEKGPKGFTLTEAARRAGVSAAAPYRHFADKAELLATVAEQGFHDLHAELVAVPETEPKARVVELGRTYVRWAVAHPDHYRVMFGADIGKAAHPGLAVAGEQAFGDLVDALTGIVDGQDARSVAAPLWALVHGVALLAIGGELNAVGIQQDPEAMVEAVVARVLG
jgi:AcrR family transcriptional regulator